MESARGDALEWALALAQAPGERHALRSRELPPGIAVLLQIASGNQGSALADASERSGLKAVELIEAVRFYLREMLFFPDADAYRLLGLPRDADDARIKQHHRLLQQWLHPDRPTSDWDATFASRVNAAWSQLRTPARRAEYDGQIPDPTHDERLDPSWSTMPVRMQSAPARTHVAPELPACAEAGRWRRRAPVLALFAVCGVLGLLAIRDMQREPVDTFVEQARMEQGLDDAASAVGDGNDGAKPTAGNMAAAVKAYPAAKPQEVAKPVAVAQVAKPIPRLQPSFKPAPRMVAAAPPPKPVSMPVAVVKPTPKPVPVAQVAKPIPRLQPSFKPAPRMVAAAPPPKPVSRPVAVVKPTPKPVAGAQVAKPIPRLQTSFKPAPRTVAAAAPPRPTPKPLVIVKPAPKPVAVAQVAKPISKPPPLLKPAPRMVAAAPKPTAKPIALVKPAAKPVSVAQVVKPIPKPQPSPKPATQAIPKALPSASAKMAPAAVAAPLAAPAAAPAIVAPAAKASPQQLMLAQRTGQQLLSFVSSSKGKMPPIWDNAAAQAQASQARASISSHGRVRRGEPDWRVGDETASMTADLWMSDDDRRRLRVNLVWREQRWLVRSLTLESGQ